MKHRIILLISSAILCIALFQLSAFYFTIWILELLVSFTQLVALILLACLIALFIVIFKSGWRSLRLALSLAVVSLCVIMYNLFFSLTVQPATVALQQQTKDPVTFTTFNKEYSNNDFERVSHYMNQEKSDVIALQETTPDFAKRLSESTDLQYHYSATHSNMISGTSAAIVSKYPITETTTMNLSKQSSLVRAVITVPNAKPMAFYSLHLVGPFSPEHYAHRLQDNQKIIDILNKEQLPVVIGGDFNTTIFSPGLQKFNKTTSSTLQSITSAGWPECSRFNGVPALCLRIDHVYIPRASQLYSTKLSPDLGSDHRALTVRFSN